MTGYFFVATLVNPANVFVASLYRVNSDSTLTHLEDQIPTKAGSVPYYTTPFNVNFTTPQVNGIIYRCILWENSTPVAGGLSVVSGDTTGPGNSTTFRANLQLIADISPGLVSGTVKYNDPGNSLAGWPYTLYRLPSPLFVTTDYTLDGNNNWTLVDGTTIQPLERYLIQFEPQVNTAPPAPASVLNSGQIITASTTLTGAFKNQALYIQGASASLILSLSAIGGFTDYVDKFYIYSAGGSHINCSVRCFSGDNIQRDTLVTKIVLGQNQSCILFKANGVWNIDNDLTGMDIVGEFIESYLSNRVNTFPCAGSLQLRSTYERVFDFANASGIIVPESQWLNVDSNGNFINKGKFSSGTITSGPTANLRFPDLTYVGYRRAKNAPGVFEEMDIQPHAHLQKGGNAPGTGTTDPLIAIGFSSVNGGTRIMNSTDIGGGTETRPKSTGVYILIRI